MKLADNPDRPKISDEFDFKPDWNIDFGITCPLVQKQLQQQHIPPCPEHSLFSFDWIFMKVADNLARIKSRAGSKSGKITLELLSLECQEKLIFDFV